MLLGIIIVASLLWMGRKASLMFKILVSLFGIVWISFSSIFIFIDYKAKKEIARAMAGAEKVGTLRYSKIVSLPDNEDKGKFDLSVNALGTFEIQDSESNELEMRDKYRDINISIGIYNLNSGNMPNLMYDKVTEVRRSNNRNIQISETRNGARNSQTTRFNFESFERIEGLARIRCLGTTERVENIKTIEETCNTLKVKKSV